MGTEKNVKKEKLKKRKLLKLWKEEEYTKNEEWEGKGWKRDC